MKALLILSASLFFLFGALFAQPTIYNDGGTLVTDEWFVNGAINEVATSNPYEGSLHYQFDYNYTDYWSGFGLNFNNFDNVNGPTYDFSGYTHLRVAYRGMSGVQGAKVLLRSGDVFGNTIDLGGPSASYTVKEIPIFAFLAGTDLDINNITELDLSVTGNEATGSGSFYVDAIELVNNNSGITTSPATWQRANAMQRGINYSNWLEAYWLIPSNSFPETNKFSAELTEDFRNLGFDAIRLPVTFENLAATTAPYTLNTSHPVFDLIDDAIQWAATYDMKLIIDMHHGQELTNANFQAQLPRLKAIWEQIVDLYGELDPERYLFEVYNEPYAISNDNFQTVAQELVDVVRAGETGVHSIIVGASGYNSANDLLSFSPLDDTDIIYTFHFYDPYLFTHQQLNFTSIYLPARDFPIDDDVALVTQMINGTGEWSDYYDAPVVAGEFGVSMNADADDRCNWINTITSLFDDNALPWFYWGSIDLSDGFGFFNNAIVSTATMTPCFGSALGLPATILAVSDLDNLQLDCEGDQRLLSWSLTSDEPAFLTIEGYQASSENWQAVGAVEIDPQRTRYAYQIDNQDKSSFYRLYIKELDGTEHYSKTINNDCQNSGPWSIYPNPTYSGGFMLKSMTDGPADLYLYNSLGQEVMRSTDKIFAAGQASFLPLSLLPPGAYWLKIQQAGRAMYLEKIVIGR